MKLPAHHSYGLRAIRLLTSGPLSSIELADKLDLDVPTMGRVLRELGNKGFVIRTGTERQRSGADAGVFTLSAAAMAAVEPNKLPAEAA